MDDDFIIWDDDPWLTARNRFITLTNTSSSSTILTGGSGGGSVRSVFIEFPTLDATEDSNNEDELVDLYVDLLENAGKDRAKKNKN